MFNFLEVIKASPAIYRQLAVDEQLITEFNCPLEANTETMWSDLGYFAYVIEGKKVWHIPGHAFELTPGKCIFVKRGAHIIEQFFDSRFCVVVFFVSDKFITETLRSQSAFINQLKDETLQIAPIDADDTLHAFFNSVVPYFLSSKEINKKLLELKFRELLLNVVSNPRNNAITEYFYSLLTDNNTESMKKVLEENFRFNFRIEEFARLCGRSLSAFKRDFEGNFKTTPGRWLLDRRLKHAQLLITTSSKTVSEIAFESGFENVSHFSRAFKQRFGVSPANYRQTT